MYKNFGLILIAFFLLTSNTVFSQNVFFFTLNNLDFGDVYIGYSKIVNHTDAGAAKFRTYQNRLNNPNVTITFTLPSTLDNGSYTIPITFGSTTSAYSLTDLPTGRTNFNPNSPLIMRLSRNRNLYLWLGGSINLPASIIPGIYSSTITVTIVVP
jgi:hypothetical protein